MSKMHTFYVDDDITFRGQFEIDGAAQTPDAGSAKAKIIEADGTEVVAETAASISGTIIYYKWQDVQIGHFKLFFTAKFNSGEDERTGVIEFEVKSKGA